MNQPTLPFAAAAAVDLVRTPRSRRDDPATSQAAAQRAKVAQHAHCWSILRVLRITGVQLNAHEIAAGTEVTPGCLHIDQVQVARRMRELLDVGLVVVDGESDRGRRYRLA